MMMRTLLITMVQHKARPIFIAAWLLFAAAYLMAGTGRAEATQCNWNGASSTVWSLSSNWSDCVPGENDTAGFSGTPANNAVLTADANITGLSLFSSFTGSVSLQSFTLTIGANGIQIDGSGTLNLNTGTLVVNGLFYLHGSGAVSGGSATLDVNAELKQDNGTFTAPSGSFTVSGGWNHTGGAFTPGTNTVTFDGTAAQALSGSTTFFNLTINNSHASDKVDASGSSALAVTNTLRIQDGIFKSKSDYHDVQIDSGATLELSGDITVSGNWTNNGTFTSNGFKVTFDGSGSQAVNGGISGSGAVVIASGGTVTFSGSTTYTGTTTINSGTLKLSASNVLADATAVTVNVGGTFDINDKDETISSLTLVGSGTVSDPASTSNTLTLASTGTALTLQDGADISSGNVKLALSGASGGSVSVFGTGPSSVSASMDRYVDASVTVMVSLGITSLTPP